MIEFIKCHKGSIGVVFAISLPLVLASVGGAIDYTHAISKRIDIQNALDASAFRVALETGDDARRKKAGQDLFTLNTVNGCNAEPTYKIEEDKITGIVSCDIETYILKAVSIKSITVSADTELGFGSSEADVPTCIYALAKSGTGLDWGSGDVTAPGCAVQVNSISNDAAKRGAGMFTAAAINVAGGINHDCYPSRCSIEPNLSAPIQPDPMASFVAPPTPDACDHVDFEAPRDVYNISPGVYCGGLSTREDVTLDPGLYVIRGGELYKSTQNWIAEGVTFRLEDGASIDTSAGDMLLTAPTSGPYKGIAIYQEPDTRFESGEWGPGEIDFSAGANDIEGTIYAPNYVLNYAAGGGSFSPKWTIIVVHKFDTSAGEVDIHSEYNHANAVPLPDAIQNTSSRIPYISK